MNTLIVFFIVSRCLQKKKKQKSSKKIKERLEQTLFVNIYAKKNEHIKCCLFHNEVSQWSLKELHKSAS